MTAQTSLAGQFFERHCGSGQEEDYTYEFFHAGHDPDEMDLVGTENAFRATMPDEDTYFIIFRDGSALFCDRVSSRLDVMGSPEVIPKIVELLELELEYRKFVESMQEADEELQSDEECTS